MTTYDNFAHTFSESRKNMKWEEIEYFLIKYAPFGNVLDVGCGNGRLLGGLINVIPNLIGNPENVVGEKKQCIRDSSFHSEGQGTFSSYLGIDASEKLLDEAKKLYHVIPAQAGICEKDKILFLKDSENISEGQKSFRFQLLDMRNLTSLPINSFDTLFFIASFHHLEKIEERIQVLQDAKNLLKNGGKIFFTNWALESNLNRERYSLSKVFGSENDFGGSDFQIKIGEFQRYYHSFSLNELEYLSKKAWFQMIENRLFDTEKNFITILQK